MAELFYFPGSPFARMARILVHEWSLPVDLTELSFPPPDDLFHTNPFGQVPVLNDGGHSYFPTLIVLERLWEMAGTPASAYVPAVERQTLLSILQMGDAIAAAYYQKWTGLGPVAPNRIGYDPAQRNMQRIPHVLDWLADGRLRTGLTLPGVAFASIVLWCEAREGLEWRRHSTLSEMVDTLSARPSFQSTKPQPW